MDYLRELNKPDEMEPSQFLLKLRAANKMATQLPNAPAKEPGFTDLQMRRQFLFAMPPSWQNNFENANLTVHNTTLPEIRHYMDRQFMQTSTFNKPSNPTSPSTYNRIQPSDPCPLPGHGNHSWDQCRSNRYGIPATSRSSSPSMGQTHYFNADNQGNQPAENQGHQIIPNQPANNQGHQINVTTNEPETKNEPENQPESTYFQGESLCFSPEITPTAKPISPALLALPKKKQKQEKQQDFNTTNAPTKEVNYSWHIYEPQKKYYDPGGRY
jgi:hypothetical protein